MVLVEKVYAVETLTAEKIAAHKAAVREREQHAAPPPSCSLLEHLKKDVPSNQPRVEAYLVENGVRDEALALLEAALGPASKTLERALRQTFARFDATGTEGKVHRSQFPKLLVALQEDPATTLPADDDGCLTYPAFLRWWLRNDEEAAAQEQQ